MANAINKGSYLAKTYTKRVGAGQINISTSRSKQRQKKKHKLHQLDQGRKTKGSYLQLISPTLYLLP